MTIPVQCQCGARYTVKDEYAGKKGKCKKCGAVFVVPVSTAGPVTDSAFDRDVFLLRQKHLAIKEKYYVWDEAGNTILYVERPAHLARNFFAVLTGIAVGVLLFAAAGTLAANLGSDGLLLIALLAGIVAAFVVAILLLKKRHVIVYRDDSMSDAVLRIDQEQKAEILNATFTVRDHDGGILARFRKNMLFDLFRKRWYCYGPDGELLCLAKEDSILKAFLRRILGPLFGLLRTNFIFLKGPEEEVIGKFDRQFTLLDRYVLDMRADSAGHLDRRVALALGVMLDTGERR